MGAIGFQILVARLACVIPANYAALFVFVPDRHVLAAAAIQQTSVGVICPASRVLRSKCHPGTPLRAHCFQLIPGICIDHFGKYVPGETIMPLYSANLVTGKHSIYRGRGEKFTIYLNVLTSKLR